MAKGSAARKPESAPEQVRQPDVAANRAVGLERLIHEPMRLGIVSALAGSPGPLTFNDLKKLLKTTDGNISVHARKLEDAGYLTCEKTFEGRLPKTEYSLTREGMKAFEKYLDHMEAIVRAMRSQ